MERCGTALAGSSIPWAFAAATGSMYIAPKSTNISFCVLSPPVMRQASHRPSPAPGEVSQVALSFLPLQASPTAPSLTQAVGLQRPSDCCALVGTREARVTFSTLNEPSSFTPLL